MADHSERGVLNSLIVACRDADRGFTFAADHVKDAALRTLLVDMAHEHRAYADALLPHAQRLGGASDADGSALATMHRAWMAVKDRVAHQDHAIIVEAERGEKAALSAYDEALSGMLPLGTTEIVESQRNGIRASLSRIRALSTAAG